MLTSVKGSFVITGLHTPTPTYLWRGVELAEVRRIVAHVDEDTVHVKLHVDNTTNYDAQYAEMIAAGMKIKKGG